MNPITTLRPVFLEYRKKSARRAGSASAHNGLSEAGEEVPAPSNHANFHQIDEQQVNEGGRETLISGPTHQFVIILGIVRLVHAVGIISPPRKLGDFLAAIRPR